MAAKNDEFKIVREFNVARETLFEVWSNEKHFKKWFSPKGMTTHFEKLEIKTGGGAHYCTKMADGTEIWGKVAYKEITKPTKMLYLQWFSNKDGGVGIHPLAPGFPKHMLTTILFDAVSPTTTKVTLTWLPHEATPEEIAFFNSMKEGMSQGWGGTFELLEAYIAENKLA